jgi:hypothetical protein
MTMDCLHNSPPRQRSASSANGGFLPSNHRPKPGGAAEPAPAGLSAEPRSVYNSPLSRSSSNTSNNNICQHTTSTGRRFYISPRIDTPDELLFPAAGGPQQQQQQPEQHRAGHNNTNETTTTVLLLSDSLVRWRYMATLAGPHQQPHDRLRINLDRVGSPAALVAGIPSRVGRLIETLHLPLANDASLLPEWLDAIATVFPNLLHLYLDDDNNNSNSKAPRKEEEEHGTFAATAVLESPPAADSSVHQHNISQAKTLSDETLVRRLYVLYRLPQLQSMDGAPFSEQEQNLSRPRDHRRQQPEKDGDPAASSVTDNNNNNNNKVDASPPREQQQPQQQQRRQPPGPLNKELIASCLLDDSSDEDGELAVECATGVKESNNDDDAHDKATALATDREVEIGLNGLPRLAASCDPDRWENASVESSAVACEWGCGSLSLPYFSTEPNDAAETAQNQESTTPNLEHAGCWGWCWSSSSSAATASATTPAEHHAIKEPIHVRRLDRSRRQCRCVVDIGELFTYINSTE